MKNETPHDKLISCTQDTLRRGQQRWTAFQDQVANFDSPDYILTTSNYVFEAAAWIRVARDYLQFLGAETCQDWTLEQFKADLDRRCRIQIGQAAVGNSTSPTTNLMAAHILAAWGELRSQIEYLV